MTPLALLPLLWACLPTAHARPLEGIRLPEGFAISVFAERVPGARSLALSEDGTVFVGTRREGKVYALRDRDGDGRAEEIALLTEGLDSPNGVAVRGGVLFVAEISRVLRFKKDLSGYSVLTDALPRDPHHGWKFIAFGPDGMLYVPVGAPCNVCLSDDDPRYASILRLDPETGKSEVFASGVRNTVGFDWRPGTRELWFTDNGRDWMGDDSPPDELNMADAAGLHFGFPFCHGGTIPDPEFGKRRSCSQFRPPERNFGAHTASLGIRFYTGTIFPEGYRGDAFVAQHGSWNRSVKTGYRIVRVKMRGARAVHHEVFASGWLAGRRVLGRPVDVLVIRDGSLLVSDDKAGAVYRIAYGGD
ncbi:MAG: sorbosone dehydrogenase [Elusimicrobia bacterium CG1_02_63_36]|nr:MAG: sorbosone dehydrogenase [Elusimicrobia bacterium CG1_02_63_36]PIP82285.1 MAG: sorbosone dehydrogenase [Elusimicrobia bacterium CG22_combo_CG10-13_8_21_14_all_63_91]PJA15298.1 MAG: sorbosone dehydrogenase [Elusimicrobia bacterium CG_4_10_14_0_2_um_filter_63_34]PJB27018.1 MAG: sorbosone dehydrogenase [Elusimicrobia bacterium CG_4_9_14_3_um_filter_62_55]